MSDKKIITVFGATGAQGGGLARAILSDPESDFSVRAVTRDPSSEAAGTLAAAGAEVVQGDLGDAPSVARALEGAYGAYCVTFFWAHLSAEREIAEARTMAEAAKAAGVQHVIWSTLDDTRKWIPLDDDRMPTLGGKYKVPHFDGKGEADAIWAELSVPTTYLLTSFYWENFIHFGPNLHRGDDGKLVFGLPLGDKKLPSIAVEDIGACAYGIFKRGEEMIGKRVGIAGEHPTGEDFAAAFSDAFGEPVTYASIPFDVYRSFDFPGADDMGNMFQFKHDFNDYFTGSRPVDEARALHPGLQDFRTWLSANKHRIPVAGEAAAGASS